MTLFDRAVADGAGPAISSDTHGDATWAEAADVVARLAAALAETDLGPNRRVLVIARNRPSTVIAHAAAALGQASSVPVSSGLTAAEIAYIAAEAGAPLALVDSATADATAQAVSGLGTTIVRLPDDGVTGDDLMSFIADREPIVLRPDQPVIPNLLFTSGTTGRPKAVQLPPKTVGATPDLGGFLHHIRSHRLAALGTHLVVGPLYHNGPLTAVRLLLAGVGLVVHERFDAEATLAAIERHRIESSIMVPTHFVRCLALDDTVRSRYDLSSLVQVAHTGGKCPVEVKRAMIEWWGPVLSESYGGTESGTVCSINSTDWLAHPGSVGRSVAPFEVVVVDEHGAAVGPGIEGRLYFRDTTGRGIVYEGDPDKTAAAHLEPGVFTLGEVGYVDEDGFVYITDRVSDMVVSGGVNIYPAEVEAVLVRHVGVADAACIGVPDAELGERLVALYQAAPSTGQTPDELRAWCRAELAGYKCPKTFIEVDDLGRNAMGKLDKRALLRNVRLPEEMK